MAATLKDIADQLGLSVNTVSRALNNKPDVSHVTRARVLDLARQLGYVPNSLARSLLNGRSNSIGAVIADVANPFYGKIIRGVEETMREAGYSVVLANTNEQDELEQEAVRTLRSKRVDGLLVSPVQGSYEHLAQLQRDGIPLVLMNRHIDEIESDYVINNNQFGAYQAVRHLTELGHTRIAHITGPIQISSVRERIAGYEQALVEAGLSPVDRSITHTRLDMDGGYVAALRLLCGRARPTAIFTYSDLMAMGVMKALRELGLSVPGDVSLVGYDDIEFAIFLEVPLTTVRQSMYEIGVRSAQILLESLHNPSHTVGQHRVVLDPILVVRGSTAAASKRMP